MRETGAKRLTARTAMLIFFICENMVFLLDG
jgi:hypothetical protein